MTLPNSWHGIKSDYPIERIKIMECRSYCKIFFSALFRLTIKHSGMSVANHARIQLGC